MKTDPSLEEAYKAFFDMIRPKPQWGGWKLWFLIGLALLLVALLWRGAVVIRRRNQRFLRRVFHNLSVEKGLSEEDEALVWRMSAEGKLINPLLVFSSMSTFNDGVGRELRRFPEGQTPQRKDLEDRLQALRRKLRFDERPLGWTLGHTREIPPGQRLRVGFKREGDTRFCSCTAVEVDERGISVTPIVAEDQKALAGVKSDEVLYVRFWRRDDTEYKFRSHLLPGSDPGGGLLLLAHGEALDRVQRRDYFRLPAQISVTLYALPAGNTASLPPAELWAQGPGAQRLEGTLIDLSAGGVALRSPTALKVGELVTVDPGSRTPFPLEGIACRVIHSSRDPEGGYTHHLEFVNVDGAHRDHMVRQIDREQINLARRRT